MAGPIHGSIEHLFLGTGQTTGSAQTTFVSIYNFLNNNTGSLGIKRIAYNTGSQNSGMALTRGMNYYDQANPAGDNAWACFCFQSASIPWYVLIQWVGNANVFGAAPGSPGLFKASTTPNAVGIAIAQRVDGGNPWNGSSGSNGSDTKGTPVWHPGTSSMVLHPRSNDAVRGGVHGSSRQNMMGFSIGTNNDYRMQQVADYDNLAILFDLSNDNSYLPMYFGQYTALSGVNPQVPYFSFNDSLNIPTTAGTQFGDIAGSTTAQGGIGYPNVAVSGTCGVGTDRYGFFFFQNTAAQPNRAFATPLFDEFPLLVGIYEPNNQVGATGQVYDFYREVFNVASHDTNSDGTRAAFGTTVQATIKLTIPWNSGTVPGSGVSRSGVTF